MSANNVNNVNKAGPNGKAKKKEAVQQFSVKEVKRELVEKSVLEYAQLLVDPRESKLVLSPAPVPMRMTAIRDKILIDMNTRISSSGDWYIEVAPTITDTVSVTKGTTVSVPATSDLIFSNCKVNSGSAKGVGSLCFSASEYTVDGRSEGNATYFDVGTSGSQIHTYNISFSNVEVYGTGSIDLKLWTAANLSDAAISNAALSFTWPMSEGMAGVQPGACSIPADTGVLFWDASLASGATTSTFHASFDCVLRRVSGGTPYTLPQSNSTTETVDTVFSTSLSDCERYRVTAQEVLLTYMGSDLSNGGVVCSARVPFDWSPGLDVYDSISQLPYDSYNGPMKLGTHVHWVPSSLDDLMPAASYRIPSTKMVLYGKQDDLVNVQTCRLMVTTVVEFFSTNPIYGVMQFCPPPNSVGMLIYWIGVHIPACTSNEGHWKKMKDLVVSLLSRGYDYARKNPQVIAKAVATALSML